MKTRKLLFISMALVLVFTACGDDKKKEPTDPGAATEAPAEDGCQEGTEVTTESGLIITDTTCGDGDEVVAGDTISVFYAGTLEDGTEFDSNIGGEPISFSIGTGQVIAGWDEGVPGMKVGGKRTLVIPPELGYGSTDYGPIPANSTLTFTIEVVGIQ